jgi:hypothetical protein
LDGVAHGDAHFLEPLQWRGGGFRGDDPVKADPRQARRSRACREYAKMNALSSKVEILKRVYEQFNARDMDAALSAMHEDVVWANGMEGGYFQGRGEVRRYWTRQWALIDPHVEPVAFAERAGGEVVVEVHQLLRGLAGEVLVDRMVWHLFEMEDGLIRRFDIAYSSPVTV